MGTFLCIKLHVKAFLLGATKGQIQTTDHRHQTHSEKTFAYERWRHLPPNSTSNFFFFSAFADLSLLLPVTGGTELAVSESH